MQIKLYTLKVALLSSNPLWKGRLHLHSWDRQMLCSNTVEAMYKLCICTNVLSSAWYNLITRWDGWVDLGCIKNSAIIRHPTNSSCFRVIKAGVRSFLLQIFPSPPSPLENGQHALWLLTAPFGAGVSTAKVNLASGAMISKRTFRWSWASGQVGTLKNNAVLSGFCYLARLCGLGINKYKHTPFLLLNRHPPFSVHTFLSCLIVWMG